jgi:hypothetical protein
MDNTNYNENYIKDLIVKVVKPNECNLIYDVNREKVIICFKFNENYYDLSDDIKYNIKYYLEKNYCDLFKN